MKISKSTIVRTIMTFLVLLNFLLERCGVDVLPTDENVILMFVETAIEISVILASWWYNNSFSPDALKAQKYLEDLRESE